jgi:hypothetical protein
MIVEGILSACCRILPCFLPEIVSQSPFNEGDHAEVELRMSAHDNNLRPMDKLLKKSFEPDKNPISPPLTTANLGHLCLFMMMNAFK